MDLPGIEPGSSRCKRDILPLDYKPKHKVWVELVFKFSDEITNQESHSSQRWREKIFRVSLRVILNERSSGSPTT